MGCNGGKDGAPIAVSAALVAMSDGIRAAPVNLRPPPHQLQRNSDPHMPDLERRVSRQIKRTREARLTSSASVAKREVYRISFKESPRFTRGWDLRGAIERTLALAGQEIRLLLDD